MNDPHVGREAAMQALIDLVADAAWAERDRTKEPQLLRMRDEAMALLPKVGQGDREATRRAMELVSAADGHPPYQETSSYAVVSHSISCASMSCGVRSGTVL